MTDQQAALTTRAQQVAELEQTALVLVAGIVLSTVVNEMVIEGRALDAELRSVEIVDKESSDHATDMLQRRAGWVKRSDAALDPYVKAAHSVHKKFTALRDSITASGQLSADHVKQTRDAFLDKLEREKQRADAEAAENQRKLEEQSRKDAAKEAKNLGASPKAVQQIMDQHTNIPPPPSQVSASLPSGSYSREHWVWSFDGTPEASLIKLIQLAAGVDDMKDKAGKKIKAPPINSHWMGYLAINLQAVNAETKKKGLASIPSIRFFDQSKRIDRAK